MVTEEGRGADVGEHLMGAAIEVSRGVGGGEGADDIIGQARKR